MLTGAAVAPENNVTLNRTERSGKNSDSGIKYKRIQGICQNPRAAIVSVSGSIWRNPVQRLFLWRVSPPFFQRHPNLSKLFSVIFHGEFKKKTVFIQRSALKRTSAFHCSPLVWRTHADTTIIFPPLHCSNKGSLRVGRGERERASMKGRALRLIKRQTPKCV